MSTGLVSTKVTAAAMDGDALYEVVQGQVMEKEPMGAYASVLATFLQNAMLEYLRGRNLGMVFSEILFLLDAAADLQRRPDLAFISAARIPKRIDPRAAAWDVVPDLAIEVVSPTNAADLMDQKVVEYFAAGVRQVWVVFPESRRFYLHRSPKQVEIIEGTGEVDGGDVLPGFRLSVADLYAEMPEEA
jgi:Uma2 family endonuclease